MVTKVTQYGPNWASETKYEIKALTPEQTRAFGKQMDLLNKDTVLNWLARLSATPKLSKEDTVVLMRDCMSLKDYNALPQSMMLDPHGELAQVYASVVKLYFLCDNVMGKAYSEKRLPAERPEKYMLRKKLLYWLAGLGPIVNGTVQYNNPKFRDLYMQGLSLAMSPVNMQVTHLPRVPKINVSID